MANFMCLFNSRLAKEIGRLYDWPDKVWSRRYQAIPVSDEEGAQVGRLAYVLSQGVKENLVERARDWPGVHAVRAIVDGEILEGYCFDRSQEYAARQRHEQFDRLRYATHKTLTLAPLPCWKHLDPDPYRRRVGHLVETIEEEAAAVRRSTGVQVAGAAAVLAHHPHMSRVNYFGRSHCLIPFATQRGPLPHGGCYPALEAARLWKAPGLPPHLPPDLPHPLEIPASETANHGIPTATKAAAARFYPGRITVGVWTVASFREATRPAKVIVAGQRCAIIRVNDEGMYSE